MASLFLPPALVTKINTILVHFCKIDNFSVSSAAQPYRSNHVKANTKNAPHSKRATWDKDKHDHIHRQRRQAANN